MFGTDTDKLKILESPAETVEHQEKPVGWWRRGQGVDGANFVFFKPLCAGGNGNSAFGCHARGIFSPHGSARGRKFMEIL